MLLHDDWGYARREAKPENIGIVRPWSTLEERDEQLDWANSQTTM